MPWGVVEWGLRLVCLLIEGIPPAQRIATAIVWFWMWWPVGKLWVKDKDTREQVERIMKSIQTEQEKTASNEKVSV